MNKIKIMKASVAKWERILAGKGADGGVLDCPPCRIYYLLVCIGCPIAEYTGKKFCRGTPYPRWYWHHVNDHEELRRREHCPLCRQYATEMRDFMIQVLEDLENRQGRRQPDSLSDP
jgi:hypothetical protein